MTHTHTCSDVTSERRVSSDVTPGVSSSAESGNPRIWNRTTVAIFGMIATLSERNPITFCCTALQTALSGLSRIVFCNCRDSDVGIIAEFRINYGTVPERIRQRRFAFGKIWTQSGLNRQETAMKNFSRSCPFHRTPSRHRPDNTCHCYDFDPIQQNLSRHSHDCNPTTQNRLSFPNVTGRT